MLVTKENNCYDYYRFIIIPDKCLLKPQHLFSASLKKICGLKFIRKSLFLWRKPWHSIRTGCQQICLFYLPPKSGFQCLLVILEILECDMTIDHHFGGVANEQRDDKNQSNQNQFDTPLLPRQAGMSGFGLTIKWFLNYLILFLLDQSLNVLFEKTTNKTWCGIYGCLGLWIDLLLWD